MPVDGHDHPLILQRPAIFCPEQLERIERSAESILEEIGIAIEDDNLLKKLLSSGFSIRNKRVFIEKNTFRDFLGNRDITHNPQHIIPQSSRISLYVSGYPQYIHDMETDKIVPYTTDKLIEATKLVHVLSSSNVLSSPPGCPADVPPPLQPIMQYWIAAVYSKHGRRPVDPKSLESVPFVMEMSEALGNPIRHLPIYVFSPLSLGSESMKCALKFRDKLSAVGVSNMASVGCTLPINVGDACALSLAEVAGSAILVRELVDLPVSWSVRLCPIDMRSMAMVLGSPEDLLLQFVGAEINAYFHGKDWHPALSSIHSNAKIPGTQACIEKSSIMTVGALLGARGFGDAGTLSLDEVFSPEQLIYDVEIRDHVQRIVKGMSGDCDPERCLRDVRAGLERRNFVAIDTTLKDYHNFYWFPKLFERDLLSAWQDKGAVNIRTKARDMIRNLLSKYDYELEPHLRRNLDRILAQAKARFL
jgi:trimethylamine:corrinoid methyltransferase-like protein